MGTTPRPKFGRVVENVCFGHHSFGGPQQIFVPIFLLTLIRKTLGKGTKDMFMMTMEKSFGFVGSLFSILVAKVSQEVGHSHHLYFLFGLLLH